MFSRGNYDKHSNKRKSDVSGRILITKTNVCVHSEPLQPSMNMSVFKKRFLCEHVYIFSGCATLLLLNSLVENRAVNAKLGWEPSEKRRDFDRSRFGLVRKRSDFDSSGSHICISYPCGTITCKLRPRSLVHLGRGCLLAWHVSGIVVASAAAAHAGT